MATNSHLLITRRSADNEIMSVLSENLRSDKTAGDIVNGVVAGSVPLSSSVLLKNVSYFVYVMGYYFLGS